MIFKLSTTCLIIILLINLVESLPNQKRWAHAASLVDNHLYIYGGRIAIPGENYDSLDPSLDTDEILYLDVSVEFNPQSPTWKSITGIAPPLAFHSMSIGGEGNELLIIFGGTSKYNIPSNPLYIFNTTSSTAATNSPTTVNVKGSIEHTSITRYNDSMVFIFGGTSQVITNDNTTDTVTDAFNDMHVLDSKSITFNTISPSNGVFPLGVYHHSSTLLSDNKIYIIGGVDKNDAFIPMGSINIFDTMTNQWSNQNAKGVIPPERRVHRAVGTNDNKIIIYGGCNKNYSIIYSDLIVLDTTTLQWTAPTTQGTPPPQMYAHTMTMVGTNVIIAFGNIRFISSGFSTTQDIYILDSTNYTWMPTYVPNNLAITNTKPINSSSNDPSSSPSSPSSSSSSSSSDQIGVIVGSIIGSLAAIFLIIVLVICIRRRRKKNGSFFTKPYEQNQPSVPPISGTIPYNQLPTTVNNQDPARQLPPTTSQFVSKSNAGSDKGSTITNDEHNEPYYNSSSINSSKTNSNRFSVIPYLDNPYCVEKDTTDPTPIFNPTSSSSSSSSPSNEHDDYDDNMKATSGINDLYSYSNNNSDYYSGKPQPPTPPSKYYDDDDDDGYPQSNRLSASSSIYAPSRPNSPPSMNPPILPSTDTSSFSSSNENNDEIMRVTDNDYDNDNAAIFPNEEAGVNEPRKVEKRAFSLRSAQRLSSTVVRPNKGTPSTTEETITEEITEENL